MAADHRSGDGAGLLLTIPETILREWMLPAAINLEPSARLGVAVVFLSNAPGADGDQQRRLTRRLFDEACRADHLHLIDWRPVPVEPDALGDLARTTAPVIEQAIIAVESAVSSADAEARCYRARKRVERAVRAAGLRAYVASMSFRTLTYKAMCAADQLAAFYPDLRNPRFASPFAIFHQRYSTNTAPSWERAQPFRMLCHNGEINTIQGNVNRMRSREGRLGTRDGADEALLLPVRWRCWCRKRGRASTSTRQFAISIAITPA